MGVEYPNDAAISADARAILADLERRHADKPAMQVRQILADLERRHPPGETDSDRRRLRAEIADLRREVEGLRDGG